MRLKIALTATVATALILMLLWPILVRHPGREAPPAELAAYGSRMLLFFLAVCLAWLTAAMLSFLRMRQVIRERVKEEAQNVRELVEGTLRDHERRR